MTTHTNTLNRPVEILLVEDNMGDVLLLKELMKPSRFPIHWTVAWDGEEALKLLQENPDFSGHAEPDLVLLDLNLPKVDGREVLNIIKHDPKTKNIPVIIMSSSSDRQDINATYQNNANFYIVKPMDIDRFRVVVKYIEDFWLDKMKFKTK